MSKDMKEAMSLSTWMERPEENRCHLEKSNRLVYNGAGKERWLL
jgi:hypothetical protein